jgi:hypothetical protein
MHVTALQESFFIVPQFATLLERRFVLSFAMSLL